MRALLAVFWKSSSECREHPYISGHFSDLRESSQGGEGYPLADPRGGGAARSGVLAAELQNGGGATRSRHFGKCLKSSSINSQKPVSELLRRASARSLPRVRSPLGDSRAQPARGSPGIWRRTLFLLLRLSRKE